MQSFVSVVIPAYNEEKNILKVIKLIKNKDIIDEIIIVDNLSTDRTAEIARQAGTIVVQCNKQGKGYAMEEGLKHVKNEVVIFLDADIGNYDKNVINNLAEPVINGEADFVKSMFEREGGRVTELVAKPMLEILFPDMYKFSQPLSGMIAGKKSLLQKIQFEKDYGVDIGILIDMINIGARVKEVHIGKLKNESKEWHSLEKMAKEVMSAILKRAKY